MTSSDFMREKITKPAAEDVIYLESPITSSKKQQVDRLAQQGSNVGVSSSEAAIKKSAGSGLASTKKKSNSNSGNPLSPLKVDLVLTQMPRPSKKEGSDTKVR